MDNELRKLTEIVLDLTRKLQADNSIRVDLSDELGNLELMILIDRVGDQE